MSNFEGAEKATPVGMNESPDVTLGSRLDAQLRSN